MPIPLLNASLGISGHVGGVLEGVDVSVVCVKVVKVLLVVLRVKDVCCPESTRELGREMTFQERTAWVACSKQYDFNQ